MDNIRREGKTGMIKRHTYPITGRKVIRLTDLGEHCHHPFFYTQLV